MISTAKLENIKNKVNFVCYEKSIDVGCTDDYNLVLDGYKRINVDNIVGFSRALESMLDTRFDRVCDLLKSDEYFDSKKCNQCPVELYHKDGKYFVGGDGNRRVLAHKLMGLKTIQAEVYDWVLKKEKIEGIIAEVK